MSLIVLWKHGRRLSDQMLAKAKCAKAGNLDIFMLNHPINGVPISNLFLNGSHPDYTTQIRLWLDDLSALHSNKTNEEAAAILQTGIASIRSKLESISESINTIDLNLI